VTTTRLVRHQDADALAALVSANRAFLAPFDAQHDDAFYTRDGQLAMIADQLLRAGQGAAVPHVILDDNGAIVGRITLSTIVRGAFQSAVVGYWVGQEANGRGHASDAVARMVRLAFDELSLHRVEAGTLVDNVRSQRVLERNDFQRWGLAPQYLKIAGRWQDHVLYQRLNPDV